jgi:pimeloyl-ACP methyl ester carboxylesterase
LLHGWGDRAAGLQPVRQALAKHFRVIVPDLPGFGGTQISANVWGLDEYAAFVAHLTEKLDVKNVYAIVGHSNGGAIAIHGLASGILKSQRLVLLASAGIRGERLGRQRLLQGATKVGKFITLPLPDRAKRALRRRLYHMVRSDMMVAEHLEETFKRIVSEDVRKQAASIALPTLLIYGEKDRSTPVYYGEILHERIAGSTLMVLPGAGHFVYMDRPHEVMKAIEDFLV